MTYLFKWLKGGLYEHWYNRKCRILFTRKRKALVEFENGEKCVTMLNALRREKSE